MINPFDPEQQDELTAELQRGEDAARQLVEHLIRMGAANAVTHVLINDERYTIRVAHEPVKADAL